ncbi:MAG: hypothetical protein HYU98_00760 [Deltaproteobacteria bacterium]|nr:hypothetical protein [Deltaproteobacteria bacterium]
MKKSELPEGWQMSMPEELSQIISHALRKESTDRYCSAADFLDELKQYIVKSGLAADSMELSQYIKDLFNSEYKKDANELKHKKNTQIDYLWEGGKKEAEKKSGRIISFASFTIISALLFSSGSSLNNSKNIVEDKDKPLDSFGTISVQARPWAYVYIPEALEKKETPVRNVKLKSGNYILKVNYEPDDLWLQKEITISDAKHVKCFADFIEQHALTCQSFR